MKGAFEYAFIMLFGLPIVVLGLNFVKVMMGYNQARYYQDFIVNTIEHQNRYDKDIEELIVEQKQLCSTCSVKVRSNKDRYLVEVRFPIKLSIVNYESKGVISTYTQQIS
ncbi:MAG: hypothetical protein RR929_02670 [Erysipelotrichaceae bacterium]